jgi:hypothetical protein
MVITGSRDRDHSRRHAPTDVLMLCGNGVLVKGWRVWSARWMRSSGGHFEHLPCVPPVFLVRFFSSTRAASILLSRSQFSQLPRAGPVKAGRVFAATAHGKVRRIGVVCRSI